MNIIKKNINLNVSQPNDFELICAMQGDNETIEITSTLYDTNQPYSIDDSITDIYLQGVTPSGMAILNYITEYTTSTVSFKLTNNMLSKDGNLKLSVVMVDSNTEEVLSTFPFVIRVVNAPIGEIQESELKSITKYVLEAKDYASKSEEYYNMLENQKGQANGIAELDENAKVVLEQLPQASLVEQGITQLTDSVTSNSTTTSATPNSVKTVNDLLNSEKNRATSAENTLTTNLNSEISRAKSAESTLATNLNSEITRAQNAENTLSTNKLDKTTVATSSTLGLVKSGTDITVDTSGNVSVNDNSHKHTISNISDLTATASELNVLDGITATTTELNYVDGVTSNIQTQLNSKSVNGHTHDDRYYTETEIDNKVADINSSITSHTGNTSNPHSVTKSQIGLGNVENKSSATIRGEITKGNVTTALGYTPNTPTEVDTKIDTKINDLESYVITNDDIDSIFS